MIAGIFWEGSGLGDQLFRYITVRTLAEEKGYEWGMLVDGKGFKGDSFMTGDFYGKNPVALGWPRGFTDWNEKEVRDSNGIDIRSYDPEINFAEDNTIIDGSFEDDKYWGHNLENINKWLAVEPLNLPDDVCVIGFRGGEYATVPDLFLPHEYYIEAIAIMKEKGIEKFEIHTDDTETAKRFFSYLGMPIVHDIGLNWRSVRYAKHLIIANSAFYIMPALLGEAKEIIAPRFWARRNTKTWARPACYYKDKRIQYI